MPKYLTLQEILDKYGIPLLYSLPHQLSTESLFKKGFSLKNELSVSKHLVYFWDGDAYHTIATPNTMFDSSVFTLCEKKILTRYNKLKYKANPIDIDKSYIIV